MALSKGNEYLNPDLHANYATALKFTQDYASCIKHLKDACTYDPSCGETKETLQSLSSFLLQLNEAVKRKGIFKKLMVIHDQFFVCLGHCSLLVFSSSHLHDTLISLWNTIIWLKNILFLRILSGLIKLFTVNFENIY